MARGLPDCRLSQRGTGTIKARVPLGSSANGVPAWKEDVHRRLTTLETQVARRMLGLFLLCAVLPILLLVVVSYQHVSHQLSDQSHARLREASETTGLAVIERLQLIDAELRMASTTLQTLPEIEAAVPGELLDSTTRIKALSVVKPGALPYDLSGHIGTDIPLLTDGQQDHLGNGGTLLMVTGEAKTPTVLVARMIDRERPRTGILWAEVFPDLLWGPLRNPETETELCVLAEGGRIVLACPEARVDQLTARLAHSPASGEIDWSHEHGAFSAGYWTTTMSPHWMAQPLTFVLSEPRARVLASMNAFTRNFFLVMALAMLLVFFFSRDRIQRGMEPLVRLQEGTLRVARGEFATPVQVESGDEFERLAHSFNTMAHQLGQQFTALTLINDIGREALSQVKTDPVVHAVLQLLFKHLPTTSVTLMLRAQEGGHAWRTTTVREEGTTHHELCLSPGEVNVLTRGGDHLLINPSARNDPFLGALSPLATGARVLLLPLQHEGETTGLLALTFPVDAVLTATDTTHARRLADQITLALANTHLVDRLEQLSWGTLAALARTIDANSPWTAGHSERVTQLSLLIGQEMGLSARDLDMLHRGGLLHDIGKIGIPPRLLEKPSRLTAEEVAIVQSHPVVGVRILAPISVFQDILPIVKHHHERFDGAGYPDRLAGTSIPHLARVVAVADVYDALVSKRPYRAGWSQGEAVSYIRRHAGAHHDPAIVEAFIALVERGALAAGVQDAVNIDVAFRMASPALSV
jgi:putative nucleotidyltransferase with HDIG domain